MSEITIKSASAAPNASADSHLQRLAVFIELEKRLRNCKDLASLSFTLVNETHSLSPYRQAVLWQPQGGNHGHLIAVSGLAAPDPSAPYSSWVRRLAHAIADSESALKTTTMEPAQLPEAISGDWDQWFPPALVRVPLLDDHGTLRAILLLARDQSWSEAELALLGYLSGAASHAWSALERKRNRLKVSVSRKHRLWWLAAGLLFAAGLVPVTQTTLAPAEIIARDPFVVRAALDGVVDRIHVQPNETVAADTLLLSMDATRLRNQLEVARRALDVADAEYRQAAQQGLFDSRANASLAILKGRTDQRATEVRYLEELQQRLEVRAPRAGVVIFGSADEWEGRPVSTGERVMTLADPASVEIEIRVPVADAIALNTGARVRLFLNTRPHSPLDAELTFASYQADLTPEGVLAYRLQADFAVPATDARIGLKGTAKLYGDRTLLILYLLRRPLTSLRQMAGI